MQIKRLSLSLLSVVRPGCKIAGIVSVTVEVRMMMNDDDEVNRLKVVFRSLLYSVLDVGNGVLVDEGRQSSCY